MKKVMGLALLVSLATSCNPPQENTEIQNKIIALENEIAGLEGVNADLKTEIKILKIDLRDESGASTKLYDRANVADGKLGDIYYILKNFCDHFIKSGNSAQSGLLDYPSVCHPTIGNPTLR